MASWQEAVRKLQQFKKEMPTLVGNEMVNFALDNIRKESFEGRNWPRRKAGSVRNSGRGLLKDTGEGERSIRVSSETTTHVDVTANEYMEAHNVGALIAGNVAVRSHTRKRRGRTETVSAHTRNMNTKLPERTFLAPSKELYNRIEDVLEKRFKALS